MIAVTDLGKSFGQQTLFSGVSLQFNPGNKYGLVGANGSGKSTFLRILTGEEQPSEGTISMPKRLKLGVLKQDHFRYEHMPILEVAMMGNHEVWEAMVEKERLLENAETEFDADRYAEVEDLILRHDGYTLESRAGEILEGLGIPTEIHRTPLSTLSGGFKLRVLLAQVLAAGPDALLLDEPTNHLDILSIRWLEKFLEDYKGTAVVISHDHRFLDNICTHIVDVDYETIMLYPGNYNAFLSAKVGNRDRKEAEIEKREAEIARHKEFIDRFKAKATKARQAQSKVKMMEKIVIDRLPQTSRRYPTFKFKQTRPSGRHGAGGRGDLQVLRRQAGAEQRLAAGGARRPDGDHRPERHRQVDPAQDRHGGGRGGRRAGSSGATRRGPATSRRTTTRFPRAASRPSMPGSGSSCRASRSASCGATSAWCCSRATT